MWMLVGTQRGEDRVEVRDRGNGIRSLQWDRGCVERLERSRDREIRGQYFVRQLHTIPYRTPGLYRVVRRVHKNFVTIEPK